MSVTYYIVIVNNDYQTFPFITDCLAAAYEVALSRIDKGHAADVEVYCTVDKGAAE